MSRYAGVWVGLKCVHDTVESSAVVEAGPDRVRHRPARRSFALPPDGLSIRPSDDRVPQEERLHMHKLPAVKAFARANAINRIVMQGGQGAEARHRGRGQGLSRRRARRSTISASTRRRRRSSASGCSRSAWSGRSSRRPSRDFAKGLATIMVVEEKRSLIEAQLRDILYAEEKRPAVIGKPDESGRLLFAPHRRAGAEPDRPRHRRPHPATARRPPAPRPCRIRVVGAQPGRSRGPRSLFLRRLPAQFLDRAARRRARLCRHRLPLAGAVRAGPQDRRRHPHGRRGRQLGGRGALLDARPCLPEHGRRHLQPLRA